MLTNLRTRRKSCHHTGHDPTCSACCCVLVCCRVPRRRRSAGARRRTPFVGSWNIYAAAGPNALARAAARARPLVYVPNSLGASVTVIDPATHAAIRTFHTGSVPQHVVPSYDLKTLG